MSDETKNEEIFSWFQLWVFHTLRGFLLSVVIWVGLNTPKDDGSFKTVAGFLCLLGFYGAIDYIIHYQWKRNP